MLFANWQFLAASMREYLQCGDWAPEGNPWLCILSVPAGRVRRYGRYAAVLRPQLHAVLI